MTILNSNGKVLKVSVSMGFSADNLVDVEPIQRIVVVDPNGFIGFDITNYFCWQDPVPYFGSAIMVDGADYSHAGLGSVNLLTPVSNTIGGKTYKTVSVGGHIWMAENLDYIWPGLSIGTTSGDEYTNPIAHYTNNDEATWGWNGRRCGLLYNPAAVRYLEAHKSELCPGWHVPTNDEFNDMYNKVASFKTQKLKAPDNFVPYDNPNWPSGWNGTNETKLSILPAGLYVGSNSFWDVGSKAYFWVISNNNTAKYFSRDNAMGSTQYADQVGMSLRLIKDY